MWNGRDHRANKINHHQPHQKSLHPKKAMLYMVGLEGSPLLQAPSGKPINSNKYCSQLNQLKAVFDKKCLELVN